MSNFIDRKEEFDLLKQKVKNFKRDVVKLFDEGLFTEYLNCISYFYDYSPRNILLIQEQCPHATCVASISTWNKKGFRVKKGAKAIKILCPIKYVDSTGKVVLYEHYETEFVKVPTSYMPSQHGYDTIAEHDKSKPGRSPYSIILDEEANEEDKKTFYDNASSLISKDFNWRDYSGYESTAPATKKQIDLDSWKSSGYAGRSLVLYTYTLTDSANTVSYTHLTLPTT